jgi:hypothetical protein
MFCFCFCSTNVVSIRLCIQNGNDDHNDVLQPRLRNTSFRPLRRTIVFFFPFLVIILNVNDCMLTITKKSSIHGVLSGLRVTGTVSKGLDADIPTPSNEMPAEALSAYSESDIVVRGDNCVRVVLGLL